MTFSSRHFPTVLVSMDPFDSLGVLEVVASNNLNADAIFSQVQISGCDPSGNVTDDNGAASTKDFSR